MLKSLPTVLRTPLKLLASAGFATVTILLCVLVLAWSTFLVGDYGLSATGYGVYNSWWFALLLLLLGINVVASTIVKLPWRRSQTGFLVVHAGIIIVLIGCWLTAKQGIDGQLGVAEGATSSTVMKSSQHFNVKIADITGEKDEQTVEIPFQAGPFSWSDYPSLGWFPWHWAHRDRGTLYDRDGIKLEVLDYAADSEMVHVPELTLSTRPAGMKLKSTLDENETDASEFTLSVRRVASRGMMGGREFVMGAEHQLPTGELVTFNYAGSQEAVDAFLNDRPEGPLGPLGQVILRVTPKFKGKTGVYRFSLAKMLEEGIVTIGDTSLRAQVTQFMPSRMQVRLAIYDKEKPGVRPRIVSLGALQPSLDVQDTTGEVIGSFWFSAPEENADDKEKKSPTEVFLESLRKVTEEHPQVVLAEEVSPTLVNQLLVIAGLPRVDLIQGLPRLASFHSKTLDTSDTKKFAPQLYVREWDGRKVVAAGLFDPNAKKIEWFTGSGRPVLVRVVQFLSAKTPGEVVRALPFDKEESHPKQRAKVRLTVGEMSETFWLADLASDSPSQLSRTVVDGNRSVTVSLRRDELELGFGVHLDDFTVEYRPGSPMPSRYASQVDFVEMVPKSKDDRSVSGEKDEIGEIYEKDVLIEVNYPAEFRDPTNGRIYRFFQTSYHGPIRPGEPAFEQFVGGDQKRDTLYFSYFTVTNDPGRLWKYAGCFMIIFGIAIMYYMKAYFFRRFSSRMK